MIESFNKEELEDKIDQYINGQLSAGEVDELWAEMVQDEHKLDYLKTVANLKTVAERRQSKKNVRPINKVWVYAAAAVIAIFVAVMGVMNYAMQDGSSSVQPLAKIEMNYYRSGNGAASEESEPKVIRTAITMANTGNVTEAISLLKKELAKTSETDLVAKLSMNIASLYYNESQYEQSISYYQRIISNKEDVDVLTLEKAYWYTGNAYFHVNNLSEARSNIRKAYKLNGAYRRVAKSYLEALSADKG